MNLDRVHLDDSSVAYSARGWAGLGDPGWHYSHGTLVSMSGGGGVRGSAGAVEQSTCKWPLQHCSFKMSYRAAQGSQRECPGDRNY